MVQKLIMIMAGGTGGHVFPALAVAEALKGQGYQVVWLGTEKGFEASVVPKAGIPLYFITIAGFRRTNWVTRLTLPLRLCVALFQSLRLIYKLKPNVIVGMGGFASGPGGVAGYLLKKPLVIHEQNAIAGVTNQLLAKIANRILEGFPKSFANKKAIFTGNPVRETLSQLPLPEVRFQDRSGPLHLLILGGSQGAQALNELCPKALELIPINKRPFVKHQCGKQHVESTEQAYQKAQVLARVEPFIADMGQAYAWADLVICRAGALTIAELALVGVGSILIPFPFAVDDHQTHNGRFLEENGAAKMIQQSVLNPAMLADIIIDLSENRDKLLAMANAAKAKARPDALQAVLKHCIEVAS